MHFHKQPSPFSLAPIGRVERAVGDSAGDLVVRSAAELINIRALADGLFELTINRTDFPLPHYTPALASIPPASSNATIEEIAEQHEIRVTNETGAALTARTDRFAIGLSIPGESGRAIELITLDETQRIGFNGEKFGMGLRMPDDVPYYGFGEKTGGLNKHGSRMKFWNLDVCADLPDGCQTAHYDPTYCAIPVAIWPRSNDAGETAYCALLIDNSGPTWFNCQTGDFREPDLLYFGTYVGEPRFYFLTGRTMGEVCAKLARLTGLPKMPPLWSLGNQQCRWGYDEERMYKRIINAYEEEKIPLHGFWLDIDYMDEYQVFTWHEGRVPSPEDLSKWMHERGVHMITIVDPGVPTREDNAVFLEGREKDLFCHAPSGELFVGMVWPGKTAFPDFSRDDVRDWWSDLISQHLARGVCGIWNDMNDPATGMSDVDDMLFDQGRIDHAHYHNLYGTFMAEATWLGFRKRNPKGRPFILTRSASTGVQQFAAVWTGDNVSSWAHLKMSIPETLNLALSGVSFNGADIGGFMESTTADLLTRWYQAAVLFPFYRNHSNNHTAHQEPWCFGSRTRDILRDTIRLRYRFIGLLYTEFARHIETGEPMVRPMCYFSPDPVYRDVADQYAVGDSVIVAPMVEPDEEKRYIVLPPGRWFDLTTRDWIEGGRIFERSVAMDDVPVFVRAGSVIAEPLPPDGTFVRWDCDLRKVKWRLHVFVEKSDQHARGSQVIDDGMTYLEGAPRAYEINFADRRFSGSFPFDRVNEVIINGIAPGDLPQTIESDGRDWIISNQVATDAAATLRPRPAGEKIISDFCGTYLGR